MTPDDIRHVVLEELSNIAHEADLALLDPAADLREALDIDSMDHLNFVTALHNRLGVAIPEVDYPRLTTLEGAVSYLMADPSLAAKTGMP